MNYDIDTAYNLGKANVVANALSRTLIVCRARLSATGIKYEDQGEDVAN